jgi:uncharacterized coiled-coil protein SlyX
MLLNEFLKEHRKMETLEARVAEQEKLIASLLAALKKQGTAIENVNAQITAEHSATRVVANN